MTNRGTVRRQRGIALVIVLWVMALLAALVVGFAGSAHTELLLARNRFQSATAREAADAAVSLAILAAVDQTPNGQWPADGSPHVLHYAGATIEVRLQDEAGKVDLNLAPPDLLANLFRTLGVGDAESLADAIVEWRREHGAANDPLSANTAAAAAFAVLDDLRRVPGITSELYERIAPFLTVYSGGPMIDPLTAPPEVLRSLPGANPADVERLLAIRAQIGPDTKELPGLTAMGTFLAHMPLRVATITATATTPTGATFVREAVMAVAPDPGAPYTVLSWRQRRPSETLSLASDAVPAAAR